VPINLAGGLPLTLRVRLTLFFVGIVVIPLVVAAFALRALVEEEVDQRANTRLATSSRAVTALWTERLDLVRGEVRRAAGPIGRAVARGEGPGIADARAKAGLDFLLVRGEGGGILFSSLGEARFREVVPPPTAVAIARGEVPAVLSETPVTGRGRRIEVVGGIFADQDLAAALEAAAGVDVAILGDQGVIASTTPSPPSPSSVGPDGPVELADGRDVLVVPVAEPGGRGIMLVGPAEAPPATPTLWVVLGGGILLAILFGWFLARILSRPLERLAEGARAVSAGNLDVRLERQGGEADVARVADAFNTMTTSLQQYVGELRESRDELRRGLSRLGATLQSTHDLDAMLGVVLDSAATTLGARSGLVFLLSERRFRLEVAKGLQIPEDAWLKVGRGVAGRAARGVPVLYPADPDIVPDVGIEPVTNTAVAVPLVRGNRTIGVLALYHRTIPEAFDWEDATTLASFATQASVAIENVLLHREAERLSITDGLTGVWNRRYLQLTLAKEIDRAQRFGRPLSVLMVDIDHFKGVNDEHGHPRGDEVLVELTRRILAQIRSQIDFLTRYGGEEFVIVLPETPAQGAMVVAEKVRGAVADAPFRSDPGPPVSVTVSIGAATYPEDGDSVSDLVGAADAAMYRAKEAGRDRVEAAWSD
jgi:two-component system cell cycle response regulator